MSGTATPRALGGYLALMQFVFASTWTVYAIYLPGLLEAAGVGKAAVPWVLIADQLLFALFDLVFGAAAARGLAAYGRIAPALTAVALLSCASFVALPWSSAGAVPLLALTMLWVASSAALRAPLYAMLTHHAATAQAGWIAAATTVGLALAAAAAPWLGSVLKGVAPALPFVLSSLALAALVLPLAWAERLRPATAASGEAPAPAFGAARFFILLLLAALAAQLYFHLAAAPRYLADHAAADLVWLMPLFWIGVAVGCVLAAPLRRALGPRQAWVAGCAVAAAAAAIHAMLPGSASAMLGQGAGGIGWGVALTLAFGIADSLGREPDSDRRALMAGGLYATLALATLTRIGINAAGLPQLPDWAALLPLLPALLWAGAAANASLAARTRAPR